MSDTPDFESFESWLVNNEIYLQKNGSKTKVTANGGYEIDEQAGHPWLVMAPNMAVHLGKVVGDDVRPM